jgi:hypothetical protein
MVEKPPGKPTQMAGTTPAANGCKATHPISVDATMLMSSVGQGKP